MKHYTIFLIALMSSFIVSCQNQKKSAVEATEPVTTREAAVEAAAPEERVRKDDLKEQWLGMEIVKESVHRLNGKLSLSDEVVEKVDAILTEAFIANGGDLETSYPVLEAKELGKIIIASSKDALMDLMDDKQKESFAILFDN